MSPICPDELKNKRMWVNVLLFLVAAATAVYFYLTRNFGWFKASVCILALKEYKG